MGALETGFVHLGAAEFHLFQRVQDLAADGAEFVLILAHFLLFTIARQEQSSGREQETGRSVLLLPMCLHSSK